MSSPFQPTAETCFERVQADDADHGHLPPWVEIWRYCRTEHDKKRFSSRTDAILGDIIELTGSQPSDGTKLPRPSEWVFRGQEDARWPVVPKSRRANAQWVTDNSAHGIPFPTYLAIEAALVRVLERRRFGEFAHVVRRASSFLRDQSEDRWVEAHDTRDWPLLAGVLHTLRCAAEYQAIHDFARIADDTGLVIHDAIGELRSAERALADGETDWVPTETTALAQHHGIATKLLDWTRRVKVAAYFATQPMEASFRTLSDARKRDAEGSFAIWALNAGQLVRGRLPDKRDMCYVRILECNQAANHFLHAQDGLFTWHDEAQQLSFYQAHRRYPSIVETLTAEGLARCGVLRKFIIPRMLAQETRERLRADRISRATVMPTYDHVALSVKHKWFDMGYFS